ncbi:MAG TPA: IS1380 family transposase [Pricia sp.]|nr:IS1380 family transposase [Pricia sp.]
MSAKITKIGVTNDKISARGGLALFLRYVEGTGLYALMSGKLSPLVPQGNKGLRLQGFAKQMLAFFIDGTDMSMAGFDQRKDDEGHAAILECGTAQLASSHQIKRYLAKLSFIGNAAFNKVLNELFIWRLKIERPKIIELGVDTMVLDNDGAVKREGCEPTYKRKKGFQPLHISWGPFLIDVMFRKGSAHSNHGTDYTDRVRSVVKLIRKRYSPETPIVLCADSGFADQKAYREFEEELGIHFITTGKLYGEVKAYVGEIPKEAFDEIAKNRAVWEYVEFGNKMKSWGKFRRCVFTRLQRDGTGQFVMDFARPDNIIYTNIGNCQEADRRLRAAGGADYFEAGTIVEKSHQRGADELIHRSIKELATKEGLPFKRMGMNRAYYFMLAIAHFLFETYKRDVTAKVIPATSYPATFRRRLIDFAVKITAHARNLTLNVTETVHRRINIAELWKLCQSPPRMEYA